MNKKVIHKISLRNYSALVIISMVLSACSIQQYIPDGELLYTGASVTIVADTTIKNEAGLKGALEQTFSPEPNGKFLGMYPGLYYYYKNQQEKSGFLNKFLYKKIGEEPVYKSDVEALEIEDLIENRLENRGFFYSRANSDFIDDEKGKRSKVEYTVKVPEPYLIETYQLDTLFSPIYKEMKEEVRTSKLQKNLRFDLSNMKLERERIDYNLKRKGYYNFNSSLLIFEVDSNQYKNKRFDVYLRMKKDVPKKAIVPYKIKRVNIYPNYQVDQDTLGIEPRRYNDRTYIQDELFFKPKYLDPYITLKEGDFYNPDVSANTARRLGTIGAYKFINIQYVERDSILNDSIGVMDANIYLSPLNKRAVRAELQAVTKSNNFAGPGIALTYSNRNLFKGGELLNLTGTAGYEIQAGGDSGNLSSIELGLGAELVFPRVIFPIKVNTDFFKYNIPKTVTGIGIDYLSRTQLYTLLSGKANFGYVWDANRFVTHTLNPISVSYTRLSNTTPEFEQILSENQFLARSFDQQFIAGLTYNFTYNGMIDTQKKHQFFLNSTFDIAGNTVSLLGQENKEMPSEPKEFLGLPYAQYAKVDFDARYHFKIAKDQTIATRLFAGYGRAYGNSEVLPFVKQYFSGGPYSVRAFRTRSLGPGTSNGDTAPPITENGQPVEGNEPINDQALGGTFFDQIGNIRLEANAEYRFPIFGFVKGAVFADAGNIWNSRENEQLLGKDKFSSNFIKELGIGGGVGIRIDVQGFVIRFDLAAPFHDPSLPEGERWDFRFDEPILNFAIGYPF